MPSPEVSVVVPVHNRAHLIMSAVASVLDQTFQDFELIIVDDGSTDDLAAALSAVDNKRLVLHSHEQNRGAAAARNTGVAKAKGNYVAFLDSDDRWLPDKLERQLQFMRSHEPAVRASCTGYVILTRYQPDGEVRKGEATLQLDTLILGCRVSPGSTLMVERALFDEVGPFDESLGRLEDWDWLLRLAEHSNLANLPEVLTEVDYRTNTGPAYRKVAAAAALMRKKYCPASCSPRSKRRRLLANLENELAASAYKNGLLHRAVPHLMKSLWYHPHRSRDTIERLAGAVWFDAFRGRRG